MEIEAALNHFQGISEQHHECPTCSIAIKTIRAALAEVQKPSHNKQIMPCPKCNCPSYGIDGYITKRYCPNCDEVWVTA